MVLTRQDKEQILEKLKELFKTSSASVASNYSSLTATEITDLRKALKEKGISLIVTKNTLVKRALSSNSQNLDQSILDQPVIFAFGQDEVEVCKALQGFAKEHEALKILGGIILSQEVDKEKIVHLALLPSREELQAKLVAILAAPTHGFVNVLAANIRGMVSVIDQYYKEKLA